MHGNPPAYSVFETRLTLNCRGRLLDLSQPRIMGILNLTPDSFSDGGLYSDTTKALAHAGRMIEEGADIIDIGACSTRPGAEMIPVAEELSRLQKTVPALRKAFPETILSIDTFREEVARQMLDAGIDMVNDISGGRIEPGILQVTASAGAPFILMHMKGTPQDMQSDPHYEDVVAEVFAYFVDAIRRAEAAGIQDIVIDPGFGFGKTLAHNLTLLEGLDAFQILGRPVLVGISRKRMVRSLAEGKPEDMQRIQDELHSRAMARGARMFRVHDVAATAAHIRKGAN